MELQFWAPLYIVSHKCTVPIIKEIKVQKNMCTHAFKCISELWILTFLFKLADSKSCRSHLPLAREILHWHGCPEVPATESGRAAEQPVHLFLQPNTAAHILYMFHVVWGNALPQIMGRHGARHTCGTCSVHKAQSLLMPPDSYDRCMQHITPPGEQSWMDCRAWQRLYWAWLPRAKSCSPQGSDENFLCCKLVHDIPMQCNSFSFYFSKK